MNFNEFVNEVKDNIKLFLPKNRMKNNHIAEEIG